MAHSMKVGRSRTAEVAPTSERHMARKRKPDLSGTDEARERRAKEVPVARGHFPPELHDGFEIHEWKHASAILKHDFPNEWNDLLEFLREFKLRKSWIEVGGKNK